MVGCETTVINHGYVVKPEDFKKITVGRDNAGTVYSFFGSPTMRSTVANSDGGYTWYYVSKMTEKTSFLDPKVIDQRTMVVTFDKNNVVKSVKESTYEKPLVTVSDKTQTKGRTAGVMGETFGGIGKYMKRYTDKK